MANALTAAARLLPPNSTDTERALVGTPDEQRIAPEIIGTLWNPATCPASTLPWLAWALSVDEWDATWDEAIQRRVIAASIDIHRHKGTVSAVRKALACLGHGGNLIEWWQMTPRGRPHTFIAEVEVDHRGIDIATQIAIERQIAAVKPARSHFTMRMIAATRCSIKLAIATLSGEDTTIYPWIVEEIDAPSPGIRIGIGTQAWGTTTVYPQPQ
jgi:phage tail P2-like protein